MTSSAVVTDTPPPSASLQYEWPTLAEEGREMLAAAILMYGVADLRALARKGLLTKGDPDVNARILNLPVSADDILQAAEANKEELSSYLSESQKELYGAALLSVKSSISKEDIESGKLLTQELVVYDDENSDSELVYGIEINNVRKRITVGFRGSVTVKDFMVDAKAYVSEIPNPVQGADEKETVGIHHGFYEYLYGTKNNSKKGENNNSGCKCDIIKEQVASLLEHNPGYRLYVTGHSLGAALAVLFGGDVAASKDPRIPKPVTVICVACPKAGNRSFLRAFKTLESQGLIRCLRIQNYKDAVTFLPDRGRDFTTLGLCERKVYKHVGVQVVLDKNGTHEFSYPRDEGGYLSRMMKNWTWYCGHDLGMIMTMPILAWYNKEFLLFHSVSEYMNRFDKFAARNPGLMLNDIYREDVPDCDSDFGI